MSKSAAHEQLLSAVADTVAQPPRRGRRPGVPDQFPKTWGGRNIMSPKETAHRVGCHVLTLNRWRETNPDFPRPIQISPAHIAYFEDEVIEYIATRPRV